MVGHPPSSLTRPSGGRYKTGPIARTASNDVISTRIRYVPVFELGEDECGADDLADVAGTGGGVAQAVPAAGEDGETAFAEAAQRSQERVVGAVVDGELPAVGGLLDRGVDAVACAFVAGVGQGGQV